MHWHIKGSALPWRCQLCTLFGARAPSLWSKPGIPDTVLSGVNGAENELVHRTKSGVPDASSTVQLTPLVRRTLCRLYGKPHIGYRVCI